MANLTRINRAPTCTITPILWAQGTPSPTTAQKNRTIYCEFGTWSVRSDQWMVRRFQWFRNGTAITGATLPFYDAIDDQVGDAVFCRVTALDNRGFTRSADTALVSIVADAYTVVDAEDIGYKALQTTGSITAGTASLACADVTGFEVGDQILVEVGGEAGAGVRGTMGVGGAWPPLSYANATAMNADTSQPNGTWAWTRDDGELFRYEGITAPTGWDGEYDGRYYYDKAIPLGLWATITAIDAGTNTLTLDRNATTTTTNANVYFENSLPMQQQMQAFPPYGNIEVNFGAGTYAFGGRYNEAGSWPTIEKNGVTWKGAGPASTTFKCPHGFGFGIGVVGVSNVSIRGIKFVATLETTKYSYFTNSMLGTVLPYFYDTLAFSACNHTSTQNCEFVNAWRSIAVSSGDYNWAADCTVTHGGVHSYIQWQYQWADTSYGGCYNCIATSEYWQACFEAFRSREIYFIDCTGTNALAACNTAGGVVFDNLQITNQEGKGTTPLGGEYVSLAGNAFIDLNGNIGISSGDGASLQSTVWVRNPILVQNYPYGPADKRLVKTIGASAAFLRPDGSAGILISGGYPNQPSRGGLLTSPVGGAYVHLAIDSNYKMVVDGIRVTGGASDAFPPNIRPSYESDGVARNCVADNIVAGTQVNNQTNAEYEA